jgi:hypothetical protein
LGGGDVLVAEEDSTATRDENGELAEELVGVGSGENVLELVPNN